MTIGRACLLLIGALLSTAILAVSPARATQTGATPPADAPSVRSRRGEDAPSRSSLSRVAPLFIENRGQCDARVGYSLRLRSLTAFFTRSGVTYSLPGDGRTWTVAMDFAGARADARPEGRDAAITTMSWFRGPKAAWITAVPTFREVAYRDLWPGIDLVFDTAGDQLKYRFELRAGADPDAIRLVGRGADAVRLDAAGRLTMQTPLGTIVDEAPRSWQETDGVRTDVPTAFVVDETSPPGARAFGFRVAAHDSALPLVIDPKVIVHGGWIGGDGADGCVDVAVDGANSAYVVGHTTSSAATFTTVVGPTLLRKGSDDVFVGKLTPDGKSLVYMGYISGSERDVATSIGVDGTGSAYVIGYTFSDETASATTGGFPVTVGPDTTFNGVADTFVAKVNPAGTALSYCGYVGGSGSDGFNFSVAAVGGTVDATGHAYVTGVTSSSQATFPVSVGPDLTFDGVEDAFVAKVKADGTGLEWCGYIGGTGNNGNDIDRSNGIAVDGAGRAFVVGWTSSTESSFPVAVGPDLTYNGALYDAYLARVKPDGTGLDRCGYIGGNRPDITFCVAVDALGRAYVAGQTDADPSNTFPVLGGPNLTPMGGSTSLDGFLTRVSADGTGLDWSGYLGARCTSLATDAANDVYLAGRTLIGHAIPTVEFDSVVLQPFGGLFFAKLDTTGTTYLLAGVLTGSVGLGGTGIALNGEGEIYVSGGGLQEGVPFVCGPTPPPNTGLLGDGYIFKVGDTVGTCDGGGGGGGGHIDVIPTESYFLPKKVLARINAKDAAKSKLVASGFFDMGGQPLDLTQPATVTVGSLVVPVAGFTQEGTRLRFTDGGLTVEIVPNPYGSSRAKFRVLRTGDLTGVTPQNGDLALRFTNAVVTDAHSLVRMGTGKFQLGRVRGALSEPSVFVQRAKAKVVGGGKDALTLVVGLATDGTTPAAAADFAVEFGGLYASIPAASFSQKGDRFTFKGDVDGVTSVTLDYLREQITVQAKNATLGAFAEGGNATTIAIQLGSEGRAIIVRTVKTGSSLRY